MLKIRCSAIGTIMRNPQKKSEKLSETCKKYIRQLVIENRFNRKKEFTNKYTNKGNLAERESIDLAQETLDKGFMYKNTEFFENDYLTGTPDVNTDSVLIDVKSKWDIWTFSELLLEPDKRPDKDYYYQLQGYMALTGKRKSYLVYCLPDTPSDIIEDEIRAAHWREKQIDENQELREHVEKNHTYSDIHPNIKVDILIIRYDKDVIKKIYERVDLCREYYNERNLIIDEKEKKNEPREY